MLPQLTYTDEEKRRFMNLQKEGLLPSKALTELDAERRLGYIIPEPDSSNISKDKLKLYLPLGAIGIAILYIYIKNASTPTTTNINTTDISDIIGIDLESLYKCKLLGLI